MTQHPSQVIAHSTPTETTSTSRSVRPGPARATARAASTTKTSRSVAPARRESAGTPRPTRSTARTTTSRGSTYRPDIDGLRAVAVIAVVLFHAGVPFLSGGFVGVDVFYVLSGFLITGLLVGELQRTGTVSLISFYARRIRRLLPASVLVLSVTALLSTVLLPPLSRADVGGDVVAAALYVSNWHFAAQATDYLSADMMPSPVLHFWSLGVEEQFYLVWPALILVAWRGTVSRTGRVHHPRLLAGVVVAIAAAVVASFILSLRLTETAQPWAFFGSPTRAWELGLGALVAILGSAPSLLRFQVRALLGWLGLSLILVACMRFNFDTQYPGLAALFPVLGTCALLIGGAPSWRRTEAVDSSQILPGPAPLLSRKPMRFIGMVSYSWYLWHWPLLVLPAAYLAPEPMAVWAKALAVAVSFGLAVATYYVVENPLRFVPILVRRPRLTLSFGAVLTASAVLAGFALTTSANRVNDAPEVLVSAPVSLGDTVGAAVSPPATSAVAGYPQVTAGLRPTPAKARDDLGSIFSDGCNVGWPGTVSPACVYGNPNSKTRVVLFGDSHAGQWFPAVERIATERNWRLVSLTKSGCPVSDVTVFSRTDANGFEECRKWRANTMARILKREHPDLIIVSQRTDYDVLDDSGAHLTPDAAHPTLAAGMRRSMNRLAALNVPIVMIRDNPQAKFDVPVCVSRDVSDTSRCEFDRGSGMPDDQELLSSIDGIKGVRVADLTDEICPPGSRCPVARDGILLYRDDDHMTATFTDSLSPRLDANLPRI